MSKDTVLVTGGAGFIGSHVAEKLTGKYNVIILDDLSGGFISNLPSSAEFIEGSILNVELVERIFKFSTPRFVFHLAAYAAEGLSPFIRRFNYTNNLIGSINLLNESIRWKIERFVFTSSIAAQDEMDPYGIAKQAVEKDIRAARAQFGMNYTIVRPHNVYGERQNIGDRYRNVIGIFMNQAMKGEPMTIFDDGEQTRCFTHIDDVAIPLANCIEDETTANMTCNIGSFEPHSVKDIADRVKRAMGIHIPVRFLERRHEAKHAVPDSMLLTLGSARINIDVGIERMAKWAKSQGPKSTKPFPAIELTEGLPDIWRDHHNASRVP